uniref:Uncharacterized protein n=1 Tax=Romanomermis culicivorax TaxID=13658 RepID=A0A915IDD2_ROMCU
MKRVKLYNGFSQRKYCLFTVALMVVRQSKRSVKISLRNTLLAQLNDESDNVTSQQHVNQYTKSSKLSANEISYKL